MQHVPLAPESEQRNEPEKVEIRSSGFPFLTKQWQESEKQVLSLLATAGRRAVKRLHRLPSQSVGKTIMTGGTFRKTTQHVHRDPGMHQILNALHQIIIHLPSVQLRRCPLSEQTAPHMMAFPPGQLVISH